MKNRKLPVAVLSVALMGTMAATALAAEVGSPVSLALPKDDALQETTTALQKENVLVLRGDWAKESRYQLNPLVDGKRAKAGEVRWSVDAASYRDEFGFTGKLTGDDIVSVDEKTGEITAKNSGIVRVVCEAEEDPKATVSVVVVVPGDVNKDGIINDKDINYVVEVATGSEEIPTENPNDPKTWFLRDLANVSGDTDEIDSDDVDYLVELADGVKNI